MRTKTKLWTLSLAVYLIVVGVGSYVPVVAPLTSLLAIITGVLILVGR